MPELTAVDIWILGERGFPEDHFKLPAHVVEDLPALIRSARELNPAANAEAVVRAIWRLGSYRLQQNLLRRIALRAADLPMPVTKE